MIRRWSFPDAATAMIRVALAGIVLAGIALPGSVPAIAGEGGPDDAVLVPDAGKHGNDVISPAVEPASVPLPKPVLALMGTIPIYWGEADGIADVLGGGGDAHWARPQLEAEFQLQPIDQISLNTLKDIKYLLMAQPRALSADENVALDEWVRAGGRLLLFADPMLTGESRFSIGDRRRPQDVVLLSPILRHWGLELHFDEDQRAEPAIIAAEDVHLPVRLYGRLVALDVDQDTEKCEISYRDVLAHCRAIGSGQVVVMADAALLDLHHPAAEAPAAFDFLLREMKRNPGQSEYSDNIAINHNLRVEYSTPARALWPPGSDE